MTNSTARLLVATVLTTVALVALYAVSLLLFDLAQRPALASEWFAVAAALFVCAPLVVLFGHRGTRLLATATIGIGFTIACLGIVIRNDGPISLFASKEYGPFLAVSAVAFCATFLVVGFIDDGDSALSA